jgi:gas vesicle structural protein
MPTDPPRPTNPLDARSPLDDWESWESFGDGGDRLALVDLVNRVLDKGVVITGDVTISLAGVDLVYLGLNAVLTSVARARESLGREVGQHRDAGRRPDGA